MAKNRYVSTRMWRDEYFSELKQDEKLLFVYCLTCPDTSLCGCYEIPIKIIFIDTDIKLERIKEIFAKFEKDDKIMYKDGWVVIKNFIRYQKFNPSVETAVIDELRLIPEHLRNWIDIQSVNSLSEPVDRYSINKNKDKSKDKDKNMNIINVDKQIFCEIIEYLNDKAKTRYRNNIGKTERLIKARINEGFVANDFKAVIDKKCKQWINTDMEKYLRPETLFGSKFEGYLNENEFTKVSKGARAVMEIIAEEKAKGASA